MTDVVRRYRNAPKLAAFIALQLEVEKAFILNRRPNTECVVTNSYDFTRYAVNDHAVREALFYLGIYNTEDRPTRVFIREELDMLSAFVLRADPSLSWYDKDKMARYVVGFRKYDMIKKGAQIKCRKLPQRLLNQITT